MNETQAETVGERIETPAEVVYETMRIAIETCGGIVEERREPGLRLLAAMAASEAIRRALLHPAKREPKTLSPTNAFRRLIAEHPGIEKETLLASAMDAVPTSSTDPRNAFVNILNRCVRRFGYFVERDGRYYLPSDAPSNDA